MHESFFLRRGETEPAKFACEEWRWFRGRRLGCWSTPRLRSRNELVHSRRIGFEQVNEVVHERVSSEAQDHRLAQRVATQTDVTRFRRDGREWRRGGPLNPSPRR